MSLLMTIVSLMYLISAACYVIGLHMMRTPKTARNGNRVSAVGMIIAVIMTFLIALHQNEATMTGSLILVVGLVLGLGYGTIRARTVEMTDMPRVSP